MHTCHLRTHHVMRLENVNSLNFSPKAGDTILLYGMLILVESVQSNLPDIIQNQQHRTLPVLKMCHG